MGLCAMAAYAIPLRTMGLCPMPPRAIRSRANAPRPMVARAMIPARWLPVRWLPARSFLAQWLCGLIAFGIAAAASAADVVVMISAGFHGVYAELGPAFERASGHHLVTVRGPSMGDSPESIPAHLARGERADVVILDGGATDELIGRGLVRPGSKVQLARSQIGMVVRAGAARPD